MYANQKKIIEPQGEIDKSKFTVGNPNTPQHLLEQIEKKNTSKDIHYLNAIN